MYTLCSSNVHIHKQIKDLKLLSDYLFYFLTMACIHLGCIISFITLCLLWNRNMNGNALIAFMKTVRTSTFHFLQYYSLTLIHLRYSDILSLLVLTWYIRLFEFEASIYPVLLYAHDAAYMCMNMLILIFENLKLFSTVLFIGSLLISFIRV